MTQSDLDLHLKAFGAVPHFEVLRLAHAQLEVDGYNAGVDDHGIEFRSFDLDKRKARYWRKVRKK